MHARERVINAQSCKVLNPLQIIRRFGFSSFRYTRRYTLYLLKAMYLEKLKRFIVWNGGSMLYTNGSYNKIIIMNEQLIELHIYIYTYISTDEKPCK